jgi:hypothetical protein
MLVTTGIFSSKDGFIIMMECEYRCGFPDLSSSLVQSYQTNASSWHHLVLTCASFAVSSSRYCSRVEQSPWTTLAQTRHAARPSPYKYLGAPRNRRRTPLGGRTSRSSGAPGPRQRNQPMTSRDTHTCKPRGLNGPERNRHDNQSW